MDQKKANQSNTIIQEGCSQQNVQEKSGDPGAARQGNFINYYQFNPPSERLSLLFPEKLYNDLELCKKEDSLVCLDVGCNSGVSKIILI